MRFYGENRGFETIKWGCCWDFSGNKRWQLKKSSIDHWWFSQLETFTKIGDCPLPYLITYRTYVSQQYGFWDPKPSWFSLDSPALQQIGQRGVMHFSIVHFGAMTCHKNMTLPYFAGVVGVESKYQLQSMEIGRLPAKMTILHRTIVI